jgi:hypothetical protein
MTTHPTAIYDAIDAFQRTHRLPGLQHAQIRGLLAEHLARVLPAVSAVAPATDQTALRDRIRRVLCERDGQAALWGTDMLEPDEYGADADAVLAVLPASVDRDTVLRDVFDALATGAVAYDPDALQTALDAGGAEGVAVYVQTTIGAHVRHMATETQQPAAGAQQPKETRP